MSKFSSMILTIGCLVFSMNALADTIVCPNPVVENGQLKEPGNGFTFAGFTTPPDNLAWPDKWDIFGVAYTYPDNSGVSISCQSKAVWPNGYQTNSRNNYKSCTIGGRPMQKRDWTSCEGNSQTCRIECN